MAKEVRLVPHAWAEVMMSAPERKHTGGGSAGLRWKNTLEKVKLKTRGKQPLRAGFLFQMARL